MPVHLQVYVTVQWIDWSTALCWCAHTCRRPVIVVSHFVATPLKGHEPCARMGYSVYTECDTLLQLSLVRTCTPGSEHAQMLLPYITKTPLQINMCGQLSAQFTQNSDVTIINRMREYPTPYTVIQTLSRKQCDRHVMKMTCNDATMFA